MRLLGTLHHDTEVSRFALFLKNKGIEIQSDGFFDVNTNQMVYQIWVLDEDRIEEAKIEYVAFLKNPFGAAYDVPVTEEIAQEEELLQEEILPPRPKSSPFTSFIIGICVVVFCVNFFQEIKNLSLNLQSLDFSITSIQAQMFYDELPQVKAVITELEKIQVSPPGVPPPESLVQKVKELEKCSFWNGVYSLWVEKLTGQDPAMVKGPLFTSIRSGEYWRVLSPAFLHIGFLHLLFNMLWVWVLCRPVEQKIGIVKTSIFTVIVAVISNTFQYLMSGPFFLGYSGVVVGLAAFTWVREKIAPWEGYPLSRSMAVFILVFVLGMTAIQVGSVVWIAISGKMVSLPIANTAHIVGGITGAILGRLSFFSQKVSL